MSDPMPEELVRQIQINLPDPKSVEQCDIEGCDNSCSEGH